MFKPLILFFIISFLSLNFLFAKEVNIDKLVDDYSQSDKKVFIYLHRTGCSYCNSMQEFTLDDENVRVYLNENFTFVAVNVSDQVIYNNRGMSGLDFAKLMGYNFYPSSLLLDNDKKIKYAIAGYKNELEFMVILKYLKGKALDTMTLEAYKISVGYQKSKNNEIMDERKRKNDAR